MAVDGIAYTYLAMIDGCLFTIGLELLELDAAIYRS